MPSPESLQPQFRPQGLMLAAQWRAQALVDAAEKAQLEGMTLCAWRVQLAFQQ